MSDFEDKLNSILSSPKDMEKIMDLARSISSGPSDGENGDGRPSGATGEKEPSTPDMNGFDPQMMMMLSRVMSEYSKAGDDDKFKLLHLMKPYLSEERRAGINRAVEVARMAKIAKIAFSGFTGGDGYS